MVSGSHKGSQFERSICKALSLWVSKGKRVDLYWRSAMSGGRATTMRKQGVSIRQSGDICSVSPEGHQLTNNWYIECKHYRDLDIASFLIADTGHLAKFWRVARREALHYNREPMLIAKQNRYPTLVLTSTDSAFTKPILESEPRECFIMLFDEMIKYRGWK